MQVLHQKYGLQKLSLFGGLSFHFPEGVLEAQKLSILMSSNASVSFAACGTLWFSKLASPGVDTLPCEQAG